MFFNEHLAEQSGTPIWSPAYVSISELFRSLSTWEVGDPVKLVCELYKVFLHETQSKETLDDFYFWGEMLISDFDDADKNMVDTDNLFTNLQDLKISWMIIPSSTMSRKKLSNSFSEFLY